MHVIIGLGNPEESYRHTRHNIGFETINKLSFDFDIPVKKHRRTLRTHNKPNVLAGEGIIAGTRVLLAKPQTYMNASGEAVRAVMQFYKLPPSEIIVIYDDTNLPAGDVRVRAQGSAGGHNGMKSIIEQLGTDQFARVRIGIGEKPEGWDLADYVLSRFKKEEWDAMIEGVTKAGDAVEMILREGFDAAMNKYNRKVGKKGD